MTYRIATFVLTLVLVFSLVSVTEKENEKSGAFSGKIVYLRDTSSLYSDCMRTKNYNAYFAAIPRVADESSKEIKIPVSDTKHVISHTGKIYDKFVTYEDVSIVGYFAGYADMSGSPNVSFTAGEYYIAYILCDDAFQEVELHITYTGKEDMAAEESTMYGLPRLDMSCVVPDLNMRYLLIDYRGGFVDVGEIRYIYTHGSLQSIKWVHAGFEFMLRGFEDYPTDRTDTFTGRMLDPALVLGAVADFNHQFDARREART